MWSPKGGFYLFRDLSKWWITDVSSSEARILTDVNRYPRHAYFLSEQSVLVINKSFQLLSLPMLDVLAEEGHAALEGSPNDRYSLYDAKRNRVLFGVGTSIKDVVTCDKWYAIEAI